MISLGCTANDRFSRHHYSKTTTLEDKLSEKTIVLEEFELGLFTGFEDTTALEDKKSLTGFSAIAVVCCIY